MQLIERVLNRCEIGDCWLWQGWHSDKGYGLVRVDGKMLRTHRVVWEELVGPIPDGLEIDHLCRVRDCVNPDHLETVTHAENMARSKSHAPYFQSRKTHCPRGHSYSGDNLYINPDGNRGCKACRKQATKKNKNKENNFATLGR